MFLINSSKFIFYNVSGVNTLKFTTKPFVKYFKIILSTQVKMFLLFVMFEAYFVVVLQDLTFLLEPQIKINRGKSFIANRQVLFIKFLTEVLQIPTRIKVCPNLGYKLPVCQICYKLYPNPSAVFVLDM